MSDNVSPLQALLREHTAKLHSTLDSLDALNCLRARSIDPTDYAHALRALYVPHSLLEQQITAAIQAHHLDYTYVSRHPQLARDLQALSIDMDTPLYPENEPGLSVPEIIGILYLLEGSKLGSQHICRRLKQHAATLPVSFFEVEGNQNDQWATFWQWANTQLTTEHARLCAVDAAVSAFGFYIRSIETEEARLAASL